MPFTFAHPAFILPIIRLPRRLASATGLVIGSMVPDFEYFLRLQVRSTVSHTIPGIFQFDLPVGLITYFVFGFFVRGSLVQNLPVYLQKRVSVVNAGRSSQDASRWVIIIISIFVGVLTHLFWDGFTHSDGFAVEAYPVLSHPILIFGNEVPFFKFLQHGGTLLGAICITFFVIKLPEVGVAGQPKLKYWILIMFWIGLLLLIKFLHESVMSVGDVIATGIAGLFAGLVLAPVCLGLTRTKI